MANNIASDYSWLTEIPIAHRGLHDGNAYIPENSTSSFLNAINHNYAIELDVQLLADGNLAVFHDVDLTRTSGSSKKVQEQTAQSLSSFTLFNTNYKIPLLHEVLALINGSVPVLIEIKKHSKVGNVERAVANALKNYSGKYAIQSFNPFTLIWFATNEPTIIRGQLSSDFKTEKLNLLLKWALRLMLLNYKSKPHFIAFDFRAFPNKKVALLREQGLPVLGWTIASQESFTKAKKFCDNIIFENFKPYQNAC